MSEYIQYPNNVIYLLIPLVVALFMIMGARKKFDILSDLRIDPKLGLTIFKMVLMITGLVLICISALGPRQQDGTTSVKKKSLDIYVLLDTSKSMLAKDILPSRLDREKLIVEKLIDGLNGDRIGFIPFSSSAYIQMPLTDDYNMAKMYLDVLDTDMIGGGGSNLGKGIKLATESFSRSTTGDKAIIVISDGEEHDDSSLDILKKKIDDSTKLYAIGVGTKKGGPIPVYDRSLAVVEYKKDSNGKVIITRLGDKNLQKLASIGNGKYYTSSNDMGEVTEILKNLSLLKKSNHTEKEIKRYRHLYQYFLGLGLILLLVGYFFPVKRRSL